MTINEIESGDNLKKLKLLQFRFEKQDEKEKRKLLRFFSKLPACDTMTHRELHEVLLCMLAYPGSEENETLAIKVLSRLVNKSIRKIKEISGESAILNTQPAACNFSYELVQFLVRKFPGKFRIATSYADNETNSRICRVLFPEVEYSAVHEGNRNLVSRLSLFNSDNQKTDLEFLIHCLEDKIIDRKIRSVLYHQLGIFITGSIDDLQYTREFIRGAVLPVCYHSKPLTKRITPAEVISRKLPAPVKLNVSERQSLADAARLTLFYLESETEPFNHVNTDDITLFALDGGISIALYGSMKDRRYSLESYIGYLVLKNNIPVAYGGGWIFGFRCQFGINLLEAFRGGESQYLFSQLLRVYHQYFNVNVFVVKPYQFGHNNPDGLKAGAFWFYYNLGFLPEKVSLRKLAQEEVKKKFANPNYRSSLPTLKKFTRSNVVYLCPGSHVPLFDAEILSREITDSINKKYNGTRERAISNCFHNLNKSLGVNSGYWSSEETEYAKNIALLFSTRYFDSRWIREHRSSIIDLIRLKFSKTERTWALHLQKFDSFWDRVLRNET